LSIGENSPEALHAYPYEPSSDAYRGLAFHDEAWHWAMLTIHGDMYWLRDRALEVPSEAYRLESESFDRANTAPPGDGTPG
jgi:hypothetical protein